MEKKRANEVTRKKEKKNKNDEKENVDNEYRSVSRPENRNDMDRRIDVIKATNSGVPAGSLAPDVPSVSYRAVIALLDGSVQEAHFMNFILLSKTISFVMETLSKLIRRKTCRRSINSLDRIDREKRFAIGGHRSYVKSRSSLYADALERYNTDAMAGRMPTYKRHHRKLRSSEPRLATRLTRSLIVD
ncbi:hypothetical protein V1478_008288 [Vespula squamosa]|uniref:Uncharacterized protein n=1 Tax=Vespula squamosa TaxID=30214 RepID=A0ABD2B0Y7_VESSQ